MQIFFIIYYSKFSYKLALSTQHSYDFHNFLSYFFYLAALKISIRKKLIYFLKYNIYYAKNILPNKIYAAAMKKFS